MIEIGEDGPPPLPPGGNSGLGQEDPERQRLVTVAIALHRRICDRLGSPGGYRDELGEVLAWLEAGYDPEAHVMAAVERAAKRRRFQRPLWLSYFRELIAEAADRARVPPMRRAGTPTPAPGSSPGQALPLAGGGGSPAELAAPPEPEGPPEWLAMRAGLRRAAGEDLWLSWFARLEWRGVDVTTKGGTLTLAAPSRFIANWIRQHHGQRLDAMAAAAVAGVDGVELVVAKSKEQSGA